MAARRIALVGPPGTGKTSIADAWCELVGGRRLSFAAAVKAEVAQAIAAVDAWNKPGALTQGAGVYLGEMANPLTKDAYRPLLQVWGTDFRRAQNPDYWVRAVERQIAQHVGDLDVPLAIDDCRFPNERAMLLDYGFVFVRLEEGKTTRPLSGTQKAHASEQHWPQWPYEAWLPYQLGPAVQARELAERLARL